MFLYQIIKDRLELRIFKLKQIPNDKTREQKLNDMNISLQIGYILIS